MENFRQLVFTLSEGNFNFRASVLSPDEYERRLDELRASAERIYETRLDRPQPMGRRGFLMRAFGLTVMPSLPKIGFIRSPLEFSKEKRSAFLDTVISHNVITLLGQTLSGKFNVLTPAVLTTYFLAYFSNLEEILRFKGSGKVLRVDSSKSPGIEVDVNAQFVMAVNLFEELLVNSLLDLAIDQKISIGDLFKRSITFGIAKTTVDRICARLEEERVRLMRAGEKEKAVNLSENLFRFQIRFYNRFVPVLRTILIFTRGTSYEEMADTLTNALFISAAIPTLVDEVKQRRLQNTLMNSLREDNPCGKLLVSLVPRP